MVTAMSSARDEGPVKSPNGPPGVPVTTPPAAGPLKKMSGLASLCGRAGERAMTDGEERLAGPVRGEMTPEPSGASDDAPRDFEQVETNRADGRRRQSRSHEDRPSKVCEQQQREAVQRQAKRVGAEAMTAETIGVDVELELLDPILRRATVVIPRDEIGGAAPAIGDHEADVKARSGDIDLDENPPIMRPRLCAMPKTRADVHGPSVPLVASLRLRDERRHARLKDTIGADSEHVVDAFGLELGFDRRCGHPRVPAQENRRVRKPPAQRRQDVPELVDDSVALASRPGRSRVRSSSPVSPSNQTSG
jgi:hypothetical protein